MKVLLISHTCIAGPEGRPKADLLARYSDIELLVLTPHRWRNYGKWLFAQASDPNQLYYKVATVRWPWSGPAQWYLHWYPELPAILRNFQPDIIDLWEEPWGLVSAQVCWLRNRILPKTVIISETEQNIDKRLPFPFENFRSYTLNNANFAIGRNREALAVIRNKGYHGSSQVVPNAVDAELFSPSVDSEFRKKLRLPGFIIGYVGRLVEEKGLNDLFSAIVLLPKDTHLILVGEGPFRTSLEQKARDLEITCRISFIGPCKLSELPDIMNSFDVLVLPSRTTARWKEQFGRVIIEAQACEIPVVGSSSGAIPDVLGEGGLVFPEGNITELACAIQTLYDNPSEKRRLGKLGRKQVLAKYTWHKVAEQMRFIYNTTMSPHSVALANSSLDSC